ncbi:MAG: PH domain-containing protein [Candidatus Kaiserbacteria bacterium]|nr:PH domain-containing protein [Candidatus Kaiserbacteria bacterium]MCB9816206.1 PH domain-containing protein [Candidatus Nomurabacteria bacterium]
MLFERIELEKHEEVLKVVRKHWFVIVTELFGTFLMLLFPFMVLVIIALFPDELVTFDLSIEHYTAIISFGIAAWSVITLIAAFTTWTHYYLDLWIITDRRIILVDQIGFFNRNVSIFRLERMQDIEFKVTGIIPTLLNFGTLKAQTAGAHESNFETKGLPNPRELQATIQKAMDNRIAELHIRPDVAGY